MPRTKRCAGPCGLVQPIDEFPIKEQRRRSGSGTTPTVYRGKVCKVCVIEATQQRRKDNLYGTTFKQRRRDHARRWGYTVAELEAMGWDTERRPIEMEAAFRHGYCPNCVEVRDGEVLVHFFRDMEHGLSDLTIDRINPKEPPVWPGNIQWLDGTCNRRKSRGDPILHGQRLQAEHELRQLELTESDDQLPALKPPKRPMPGQVDIYGAIYDPDDRQESEVSAA